MRQRVWPPVWVCSKRNLALQRSIAPNRPTKTLSTREVVAGDQEQEYRLRNQEPLCKPRVRRAPYRPNLKEQKRGTPSSISVEENTSKTFPLEQHHHKKCPLLRRPPKQTLRERCLLSASCYRTSSTLARSIQL